MIIKKSYKKTAIIFSVIAIAASVALMTMLFVFENYYNTADVKAAAAENLRGWAWSENIGWISFNDLNCDLDGDGKYNDGGLNDCPDDDSNVFPYGVNVDLATGNFSGYAWSSNIGWISFKEGATPPDNFAFSANCDDSTTCDEIGDGCTACYNSSDNNVYGWAKILALGNDGWLKMKGTWVDGVNVSGNDFAGWAWNDDGNNTGIGWVSFNCANEGSCAVSNYKVHFANNPPTVTPNAVPVINLCVSDLPGAVSLSWIFTDAEDASQTAYQIDLVRFPDATTCTSGKRGSSAAPDSTTGLSGTDINSFTGCTDFIHYGGYTYDWEITVWDSGDLSDGPKAGDSFPDIPTASNKCPNPAFTYVPANPGQFEIIDFTDNSECYDISENVVPCSSWKWDFDYPDDIDVSAVQNPNTSYSEDDSYEVNLEVTDPNGNACSISQTITINKSSPDWNETTP